MMKPGIGLLLLLLFTCPGLHAQMAEYSFKRKLPGITATWHSIHLPDDIFGKVSAGLSDLRIFGITAGNDTIEAPYILKVASGKVNVKEVNFSLLNQSRDANWHYLTFGLKGENTINRIWLDFRQQNFDWKVTLEGSHDQKNWLTIVENYRILSIKNALTTYKFCQVIFPPSNFPYFRLKVNSIEKPVLLDAKTIMHEENRGDYRDYTYRTAKTYHNSKTKQTIVEIDLYSPVPISYLKAEVIEEYDYYRPVTIQYLSDSFNTPQGWKYNYKNLTSGTLNSVEGNEFSFNSTILKKLRIVIHNHDNQPLTIGNLWIKGYVHQMIARFSEPAEYYLVYGNPNAITPGYDIHRFTAQIPAVPVSLTAGEEELIEKPGIAVASPLFESVKWLWVTMTLVIGLLGWFSVKMIRNK